VERLLERFLHVLSVGLVEAVSAFNLRSAAVGMTAVSNFTRSDSRNKWKRTGLLRIYIHIYYYEVIYTLCTIMPQVLNFVC
jgi:hypothetical protein